MKIKHNINVVFLTREWQEFEKGFFIRRLPNGNLQIGEDDKQNKDSFGKCNACGNELAMADDLIGVTLGFVCINKGCSEYRVIV